MKLPDEASGEIVLQRVLERASQVPEKPSATGIVRAALVQVDDQTGELIVQPSGHEQTLPCDLLITSASHGPDLQPGDTLLVLLPDAAGQNGCVLGRVGTYQPKPAEAVQDKLVIEATDELTLKCGDGSITMRRDGRVLIKGKDLVSRAQRMNRIKGGAVAIN